MNNSELVNPQGLFGWSRMWLMLRMVGPGFDLPEFLAGTKVAYVAVTRLMYERQWDALRPLVSAPMLKAMQATMEEIANERRRVVDVDLDDSIEVQSAVLRQVLILKDESDLPEGFRRCHLDVRITSRETWRMFDYNENEALEPFDGRARLQESTWRFEGVLASPWLGESEAPTAPKPASSSTSDSSGGGSAAVPPADEGHSNDDDGIHSNDDDGINWTVHAVVG